MRQAVSSRRLSPRFYMVGALLVGCAIFGGSSRADSAGLLVLRPLVVILLGMVLFNRAPIDWRLIRVPMALLFAFAVTIAIQLIPMPPSFWLTLPGHAPLAASVQLVGSDLTWRPMSLDPDLTLNALIALLPALTVMIGYAGLQPDERQKLLVWPVAIAVASAVLGLAQIISGEQSAAYINRFSDRGVPIGLLANRNHQGVLLALSIPVLWLWSRRSGAGIPASTRSAIAAGATLLFIPMILMTGSRVGTASAAAALLVTPWVVRFRFDRLGSARNRKLAIGAVIASGVAVLGLILYTVLAGQALSVNRIASMNGLSGEKRIQALPVMLRMLWDFFPTGIGYGAFDPVFRMYEPYAMLMPTYFNRAHSDPLELALSGGLPAVLVMAGLLAWLGTRLTAVLRQATGKDAATVFARLGCVVVIGWLLASIADYPLRTPSVSVLFILAALWLEEGFRYSRSASAWANQRGDSEHAIS